VAKMHKELLSNKERQMLKLFLANGEKGEGYRMLKMRIRRNYPTIVEDFELLTKVKDRM
jgi:hypothetical protein